VIPDTVRAKIRLEECPVVGLDGDCWNYYGRTTANGYGTAYIDGQSRRLHRYLWELLRGDVPDKLELDHLCRSRRCCNPDHLEPVTAAVNKARAATPPYRTKELHEMRWWQQFTAIAQRASIS